MIAKTIARLCEADSVGRKWCVDDHKMKTWVDVSFGAMEVVLEVNKNIVKDASWLHPTGDTKNINLAEPNTSIKRTIFY